MADFYEQLDQEAGVTTDDFYTQLDQEATTPEPQIAGIWKGLKRSDIIDVLEHVPVPTNPYQGAEKAGYLQAKARLEENQYDKYTEPKYEMLPMGGYSMVRPAIDREQDLKFTEQYDAWENMPKTKGYQIAHGILDVFPWVADIAITGGIRASVKAGISAAIKSPKLATAASLLANAAVASSMQPGRFNETAATIKINDPELSDSQVYTKTVKRLYIENLSEMTGEYITKGLIKFGKPILNKLPFGGKLIEKTGSAWRKMFNKSADDLMRKISDATGVNSLFGEVGEERVNTILQGLVDADDFGAGKDAGAYERIVAGMKQDVANIGIELPILMVPTAGRYVAAKAMTKMIGQQEGLTDDQAAQIFVDATKQIDPKADKETQQKQLKDAILNVVKPTPEVVEQVEKGVEQLFVESKEEVPTEPVPIVEAPKPKPQSRKQLLGLGHIIPKKLGWTDEYRRDFIEGLTGKRSLKGLKTNDLRAVIDLMQEESGADELEITEADYDMPIQIGDRTTTMTSIMKEAADDVEALPEKVKVPEHVTKKFARKREGGLGKRLKEILWGEENSSKYHLANKLGGTYADVLDTNIEAGRRKETGHLRVVYNYIRQSLGDAEISDANLATLSKHLNPRFRWMQKTMEGMGTDINEIEIGDRTYDMTWAELMDFYLITNQEDGLRHVLSGGLVIDTVETGTLSEEKVAEMRGMVENNNKAKIICDTFLEVGESIWKPSINNVSNRIEGRDIAKIPNWWGLEVLYAKRLPGKQQKFSVNFIENRSIFKDRTKSERPLVIRDAFSRFAVFENGISEYVGLAEPTRISRTLLNNPDLSNALNQKGYGDTHKKLMTIMERAQSLPKEDGAFGKFMSERLPGLYRAYLYTNSRVILSQFTSVGNYGAFVSGKYMTHAMDGLSAEAIRETLEMSDIAYDRFFMAHSSLALGEMAKSDSVLRMFTHMAADINKLGIGLRMADIAALASGLQIAKAEFIDAQAGKIVGESAIWWADKDVSGEEGSLEWKNAVVRRAEWLWQRSQPSWDKWNRSMMTSGLVRKVFFPFRTFHEKSLTIIQSANMEYDRSNKTPSDRSRQIKKHGAVYASYAVNTIMRAAIMGVILRKPKEPWQYVSDLLEAPMSMFPILGTVLKNSIGNFINVLIDEKMEFHGEAVEAFPARVINLIAQAPADYSVAAAYYLDGKNDKARNAFKRATLKLYQGIGTAEGVPVSEINRVYKGWIKDEDEGTGRGRRARRR